MSPVNSLFQRTGYAAAFLGLLAMANAHWAMFQVIAWGNMLVTYSSRSGIETGIRETFDGQHPCSMCKAIQRDKASADGGQEIARTSGSVDLRAVTVGAAALWWTLPAVQGFPEMDATATSRLRDPPRVPPPQPVPAGTSIGTA